MNTFLGILAIYYWGEPNTPPFVAGVYDTEIECVAFLSQLTQLGWSFGDGYELGNMVYRETDEAAYKAFCVEVPPELTITLTEE